MTYEEFIMVAESDSAYSRPLFIEGALSAFDLFGISSTFDVETSTIDKPESEMETILRNFAEASKCLNDSFRLVEAHAGNEIH
jgi:hypothetical protein